MLEIFRSTSFKRDVKRMEKRGKDMRKLRTVLTLLIEQTVLPERLGDHPLRGEWASYRDLHVEPDWLLIYRIKEETLELARTGSHSDLFQE